MTGAFTCAWYKVPVTRLTPLFRAVLIGVLLFGIGWLMLRLRVALTPVLFALLFSYALDPLVARLEAARMPRSLAIALLLFIAVLLICLFVFLVLPTVLSDLFELVRTLALALGRFSEFVRSWLQSNGVPVPPSVEAALENLSSHAVDLATEALSPMGDVVSAAVGGTVSLIGTIGMVVMVPVFAFYFLHDFDRIMALLRDLLPLGIRADVVSIALQVDRVLSDFVRGQLTVMGIMATLYAVGYMLIGVPLAVPIGLLAGFLTFVPYVGSAVALVFGLLMVLLHFHGFGQLLAVLGVYIAIQTLDGIVITPRVVGGKLGLSPVWVLFALTAFGQLFGLVGVMLALPASAVTKVFVVEALNRYRSSSVYLGSGPVHPARPQVKRMRVRRGRRDRVLLLGGSRSRNSG
jgi:predicted PurR-regulated permease PerM